jgi:HPt (histidine-containing phosphotransfer) domain-containing protein
MAVIDRSVLGEWLGDDDAGIDALLAVFRDSICVEHERLRDILARGDLIDFARTAHRMRGAALAMGARGLAEVAATLNAAAQKNDDASCRAGMAALDTHVHLMVAEVPASPIAPSPSA